MGLLYLYLLLGSKVTKMKYYQFVKAGPILPYRNVSALRWRQPEEYCWAMTQVAGQLRCGRSHAGVLESGIKLDPPLCIHTRFATCTLNSDLHKTQSVSLPPQRNFWVVRAMSAVFAKRWT
jgi:hypothetical protein